MNVTALNFMLMNLGRQKVEDGDIRDIEKILIQNCSFISM